MLIFEMKSKHAISGVERSSTCGSIELLFESIILLGMKGVAKRFNSVGKDCNLSGDVTRLRFVDKEGSKATASGFKAEGLNLLFSLIEIIYSQQYIPDNKVSC